MKIDITKETNSHLTFRETLNILKAHKWLILLTTSIFISISYIYIYFKEPIYLSYSIIKVKSSAKEPSKDLINSKISGLITKNVLEEISLLKTYKVNKQSLDSINFTTKYYKDLNNYKRTEIFGNTVAIDISDIQIYNTEIIGKVLTLTPTQDGDGYTLSYQIPYQDKIKQYLFGLDIFKFKTLTNNNYGKNIQNNFFKLKINKKFNFSYPIHFILNGGNRDIFEKIIYNKLNITQLEKDTSLIKISYEDTIPQRATLYVDALTKSFIDYSIESKNNHNSKTLNFIIKELKNIKQELKDSEKNLELHQISKNIVRPSEEGALYIKNLSTIEIKISENKLRKKLIKNLISFIQNNYNLDAIAPSISKLNDSNTLALITKLQNNQIREEELKLEYTNEYPELKNIHKKISKIRNQIEYNLKSLHTNIEYENINLLERKKTFEENMRELPSKERELVNITRNYEVKSKMYEYLLKKQAENNILQLSTFSDYQIIDNAYNTNKPVKPKRLLILILNIFLGLLLGFLLAFLKHSRNVYIHNKRDIEKMTSLQIYGTIPYYKQKKNTISLNQTVKSPFSEAFRNLRTNLQFTNQANNSTSILITSTIASEGKSTTAANLATILEMAKYRTIIVNFDLRKPALHKFFNVVNDKGISTYLSGQHSINEIIEPTEFANLDIIPSGPIPSNPSELILAKELPLLFKELKKRYEYIIIDTAPIGIISDTKTLMQFSDLNLIIIRENYAKKEFIVTLEEMISKHDFKKIGLILNASKEQGGEYGYGYSYEYK
ncbi:MAG: Tyrosine-protein kinase Wzc (EC [uncultured Sulfurovum sp.]|uniref:non-specific protein-tyrosine kinase n=1 Tax=uncultured Sulfurovum sp. TaxID=269237 RepID=A0A6S6U4F3_9BACT|nr:MAG: Tyrosine-protein kinase Wzc (EC [uncultured Sulfurovum sp.]